MSILGGQGFLLNPRLDFPDPFLDMSSLAYPQTMQYALRWCEFIFMRNGTYRQAVDRVLSYFITDVEITDAEDEDKEQYEDFMRHELGIYKILHTVGMDYMCYGNAFITLMLPFRRWLYCPTCYFEAPLRVVYNDPVFQFEWSNYEFHAYCPRCKKKDKWGRQDRRDTRETEVKVKRWNPHEIELLYDPLTDDIKYIWKIPDDYRQLIRQGHLHHLERANWEVIEAVKNNNNMEFDKDVIFHMKEDALAGIRNRGWGISRVLTNFSQAWYVQVLRRFNEAIALDYVIPFRVLTPVPQAGADAGFKDPLLNMNLGNFNGRVNMMLRQHRRDPATWHVLPFPIQYQALGGDATKLAPRDLLDQGLEVLLNDIGVPAELYKGSLQVQTAPAALRLFESSWTPLVHNLNGLLRFIVNRIAYLLSWKPVKARLMRVTVADDMNKQMALLQLMMGKQISPSTGLKSVGLDYKEEVRKIMEDQETEAEEETKMQEDMDRMGLMDQMQQGGGGDPSQGGGQMQQSQPQQQGGQGQQGAAPAQASITSNIPMGPNQKTTPQEMLQRAQTIAQQVLGLPESQKDSELIRLKKTSPALHDLVRSQIDQVRQQAKTVGGSQVMAQQFGKTSSVVDGLINNLRRTAKRIEEICSEGKIE